MWNIETILWDILTLHPDYLKSSLPTDTFEYVESHMIIICHKIYLTLIFLLTSVLFQLLILTFHACLFFIFQWESVMVKSGLSDMYNKQPILAIPLWIFKRFYTMLFMGYPLVSFAFLRWSRIIKVRVIIFYTIFEYVKLITTSYYGTK